MIRSSRLYDDTDSLGRYSLVVTNTTAYRLREHRPSGGTGGWKCSYPNASTSGGFASGKGGDFGCGWGPIASDAVNGKDFGNYEQPKITVIKKLLPAGDPGASTSRSTARWSRRQPATAAAAAPSSAPARTS